jgi:type IV secretory pathway VirD2 relaxase
MSGHRNSDENDRFRVRPGAPKHRGQAFISKVLKQAGKAGPRIMRKAGKQPGARLGRGHVTARFAGQSLAPSARRATVKTRLVNLRQAGARSTVTHLRYIEREGVGRQGEPGRAYGPATDEADQADFEQRGRDDRHQFRFIVSPEDSAELGDLHTYTRHLMAHMEADLGTKLEWVAVDHWNTDNPHTHIVLRGKDDTGKDLIIARDYIAHGLRARASELATDWLGPRTELEIQRTLQREVDQERWTSLDRTLQHEMRDGFIRTDLPAAEVAKRQNRTLLVGRLQRLQRMGLASEERPGMWTLQADAERVLRAMGERGDIVRTMQRAMRGALRDMAVFTPGEDMPAVVGRVVAKGLADEMDDKGYLIVDGIDGKAHYVTLPAHVALEQYPVGAVVEARGAAERAADRNITELAVNGVYRSDDHLAFARGRATSQHNPEDVVRAHIRRLEALRRAGIVERLEEGVWRVPTDLPERGQQYDRQHAGGVLVEVRSHLSIERQTRAMGATWLDQQLVTDRSNLAGQGFGSEVRQALEQRTDFLIEQGLAERRGQRVMLARNLLATLRGRELAAVAQAIAAETGLTHLAVIDGQRVSGVYRRSVQLASGRFAMVDDGLGFSLVPWRPVLESRLGQTMAVTVRGQGVSWEMGRQRSLGR